MMGLAGRSKVLGVAAWRGESILEHDINSMLAESDVPWTNYEIVYGYHAGGFGRIPGQLAATMDNLLSANTGLWLDGRFTGKMAAALIGEANAGRLSRGSVIVALHTGLLATKEADARLWDTA